MKGDRRIHIIENCLRLVREQPVSSVDMRQIAQAAGMSAGNILYYFGTKDDLLFETWMWMEEGLARRRRLECAKGVGAVDKLKRFIEVEAPSGALDPSWTLWFFVLARQKDNERLRQKIIRVDLACIAEVTQIVRAGMESGEFVRGDADDFGVRFMALVDGLAFNVVNGSAQISQEAMMSMALAFAGAELGFEPL